jgi:outer membrane protein assembly factor BamB
VRQFECSQLMSSRRCHLTFLLPVAVRVAAGWALFAAVTAGGIAQVDGALRWSLPVRGFIESSPAVGPDGTLYIGVEVNTTPARGRLLAVNPGNLSAPKWELITPDYVWSSPLVAGGVVYFGCMDGKLYARDAQTGARRWEFDAGTFIYSSPAIGPDGTLYVGSGSSALHAISPDGAELWRHAVGGWIYSSPAVAADGTIYFGSWDENVYAVNPDGSRKWRFATDGAVFSSPAIGPDGTVYIGSLDGSVYAISGDGALKWRFPTGGPVEASPALAADGTIYVGSWDGMFYAITPAGQEKWKVNTTQPITSSAVVRGDGVVIFGDRGERSQAAKKGRVRALNSDGSSRWTHADTTDIFLSSPVVAPDGTMYIGTLDGFLLAFEGAASPVSLYSAWPMFRRDAAHTGRSPVRGTQGRLINLASRAHVNGSAEVIAGFVIRGNTTKFYMIRAVGPALSSFGVPEVLGDPTLTLWSASSGTIRRVNDDWGDAPPQPDIAVTAVELGAFPLQAGSKDAALLEFLEPGAYTAVVSSADAGAGVVLVEAFDANVPADGAVLINLSTRARVGAGDNVLIPGFVIAGAPLQVLVRAVGPGLARPPFNVPGTLAQPSMTLFANGMPVGSNSGWTSGGLKGDLAAAAQLSGAFPLVEASADAAMIVTLPPGNYTLHVSGLGNATGEALAEIYVAP